jgi:alpha-D-xyloside xylohydrolase
MPGFDQRKKCATFLGRGERMPISLTGSSRKYVVVLFIVISSAARGATQPQFSVKNFTRDTNGLTVVSPAGTMRIEVCGNRVVHVVASPTSEIPAPKVPVVIQPCKAQNLQIVSAKKEIRLSTDALTVTLDTETGALTFLSLDGKAVLAEPKGGGKAFDVPSIFETKNWQVQQTFLSPPDEALYGLGQHQEGILNVRGIPIRLHQANTNISIPFMLSSRGYGLFWNNPSLTDFNPADQLIEVDT